MSRALGRYELLRPLARGGMGEVYLARRRAAGVEKWLVVKKMRPERAGDARFLDLFMREARLSMSLAHQNIVPVFDFGRIDDQVFLAMERVEGKDLGSSMAKAGKPLPPLLAAFIAAECCQALDYAHRRKSPDGTDLGIVHRDVTPRNVLLSWSGEVKLTDFGIAALAGDEPSKMAGTPAYMAPEQARGEATNVRADIYAVGMVLREALTGVRPRHGNDRETVLAAAQAGRLDPWPDGFESPLQAIIDRATAINKDDRYPDARMMLAELDEFILAERAAKKADAPARQLAAWLAVTWEGETDDVTVSDVDIQAEHMMSFLDDGVFDVVGTGTQRSLAMTAAEEPALPPAEAPRAPSHTDPSVEPLRVEPRRRSRLPWILLGAVTIAAVTTVVAMTMQKPEQQPERVVDPPVATLTPDAKENVVEPAVVDAIVVAPIDAAPADARVKPHNVPVRPRPDARVAVTPPAVKKYKVVINTVPKWSYFTVDNDPTKYQSFEPLMLTPGSHTIHFTGNEHFPADKTIKITVPEQDGFKVVEKLDAPAP
jgi:eukaryotic-like serine/threonine-protein kinase